MRPLNILRRVDDHLLKLKPWLYVLHFITFALCWALDVVYIKCDNISIFIIICVFLYLFSEIKWFKHAYRKIVFFACTLSIFLNLFYFNTKRKMKHFLKLFLFVFHLKLIIIVEFVKHNLVFLSRYDRKKLVLLFFRYVFR